MFLKLFVSLIYDGISLTRCCRWWSTKREISEVWQLIEIITCLPGLFFYIFWVKCKSIKQGWNEQFLKHAEADLKKHNAYKKKNVCIYLRFSVCIIYTFVCIYVSVYLSIIYLSIYLSICLSIIYIIYAYIFYSKKGNQSQTFQQ